MKRILVTGSSGFIGANLVLQLLKRFDSVDVVGIDNMNDYYDVSLKEWRLEQIEEEVKNHPDSSFTFVKGNIADKALVNELFGRYCFDTAVNLAAQAGVRYSIINPDAYIERLLQYS